MASITTICQRVNIVNIVNFSVRLPSLVRGTGRLAALAWPPRLDMNLLEFLKWNNYKGPKKGGSLGPADGFFFAPKSDLTIKMGISL